MNKEEKKPTSIRDRIFIAVFSIVIVICLVSVAAVFLLNSKLLANKEEGTGNDNKLNSDIVTPVEVKDKIVNILVAGIDYTEKAGSNRGKLTDVIMVVSFDIEQGKVNVLQIPRDTYIGSDYTTGKINAIYSSRRDGGIEGLANKINQTLKLSIDHYVTINMDGFITLIDAIGGVEVDVPETFTLEGVTLEAGPQVLSGFRSQIFVRERHSRGGDLGRLEMQKLFLNALVKKVKSLSMTQIAKLAPIAFREITTDLTLGDLLGYYNEFSKLDTSNIDFFTLPVRGGMNGTYSVVVIDAEKTAELLNESFRPYSEKLSADQLEISEPRSYGSYSSQTGGYRPPTSSQPALPESSEEQIPENNASSEASSDEENLNGDGFNSSSSNEGNEDSGYPSSDGGDAGFLPEPGNGDSENSGEYFGEESSDIFTGAENSEESVPQMIE